METNLTPQENIAKNRREAQLYLQERGIWKMRIEYKKHWQDYEGQSTLKETEMTYQDGETKEEATPPKIYDLTHGILSEYHPKWKKGSRGYMEWNLETDRLEVQHEEEIAPTKEEVSCEKTYYRGDSIVRGFLDIQERLMKGQEEDTEEIELSCMIHIGYRINEDKKRETLIEAGIRRASRKKDKKLMWEISSDQESVDVAYEIYKIAKKNAERDKRPLAKNQDLERVTIEASRKGRVMIKSVHIFEKEPESAKPRTFIIMPNGEEKEIRTEEPIPTQITSWTVWIIPFVITILAFIPLLSPWICRRYLGDYINITATFPIVTTAILAWIRLIIRKKTWKEALKKRTRRLAGVPEHPCARMDKQDRFVEREWIYIKDYFDFIRTFTEKRRGNVIAIEEAAKTEKEHDHATATMRKQEEANAVAFLRDNYAKHEKNK